MRYSKPWFQTSLFPIFSPYRMNLAVSLMDNNCLMADLKQWVTLTMSYFKTSQNQMVSEVIWS